MSVMGAVLMLPAGFHAADAAEPMEEARGTVRPDEDAFSERIAPLLAEHCLGCHSGPEPKGGLDLTRRESALAGGDGGVVLVPGDSGGSPLWEYVRDDVMPPETPLNEVEKSLVRAWIDAGADWGGGEIDPLRDSTSSRAGYDWWSLQPLASPEVPRIEDPDQAAWIRNGVDAFIAARLHDAGLSPSPEADRRVLIRRLYCDLLGLPPSPEQVEAFLADDSPEAYERLVERLLGSQHYGERWARHWLDVVRFGESQGFERDKVRPNAWRYRDWVIRALNADLPYDEFARLQIAGDVLHPDDADAVIATGFLVAGPYDEVGQNQQSAAMRAVVRQDELEDIVGAYGQTFLGLTVHCARCHDHKFDPISQREYYQLAAALGGVRHGERPIMPAAARSRIAELQQRGEALRDAVAALEEPVIAGILEQRGSALAEIELPQPVARWTFDEDLRDEIAGLEVRIEGNARIEEGRLLLDGGYAASEALTQSFRAKTLAAWVQLDNLEQRGGGVVSLQTLDGTIFDAVVFGEREPRRWMAGSDGFRRSDSFQGPEEADAETQFVQIAVVYAEDGTITGYRNGQRYGEPYRSEGPVTFAAGQAQILFGLRHGTAAAEGRLLAGAIDRAEVFDRALSADQAAALARRSDFVSSEEIARRLSAGDRQRRADWLAEIAAIDAQLDELKSMRTYAVVPEQPDTTHLLLRGDPAAPADPVVASGIAALSGVDAEFGLPVDAPEGRRRMELAAWTAHPENPLFARVICNRVWHYHFGAGIVRSPNDFGFNGGRPSHPQLLDALAEHLIEGGWSLKELHRLIVTSATYRQSSRYRDDCAAVDAGNRLLWRKNPTRLEAEALRDAILSVAGELNPQVGGPPYRDFETFTFNSQFYEMIDPVGPEFHRRTIYRTWIRSGRNPLLDVFDCPDPSTTAPRRAVTTTPVQSLVLLNNSFVLRMADAFAERARRETSDDPHDRIRRVYELAYSRAPTDAELDTAVPFVERHGLAALCRVVFNSNEFLYVE